MREEQFVAVLVTLVVLALGGLIQEVNSDDHQPLSTIAILETTFHLNDKAYVKASPTVLGSNGQHSEFVLVEFSFPHPTDDDWIGVFSPADFMDSTCPGYDDKKRVSRPRLCSAPIKYQYANYSNSRYNNTGVGYLKLQLINQRSDFSFALFSGRLSNPKLVAVSNKVTFENPKAPVYPRLALGKEWDEMTVTWTSGYRPDIAEPVVEWGIRGGERKLSPAGTLTFGRNDLCGAPAWTVGWRDPGYIHTAFLKDLWPISKYTYRVGHRFSNGDFVWSKEYQFKSSPFPGQNSLQHVVIFGDMGKAEVDGSKDYNGVQSGSLNTTKQLIKDLNKTDAVFHIGDLCYASGYLSQWDQFTAQIEPIASTVPYMIASGNHERDWPYSGSFYDKTDSGGECGVPAETMFYIPAQNRARSWYSSDYGMFRFCVVDTELNWIKGTDQYKFIEHCLASVDRKKQPWLIFLAHRVLGYSSTSFYAEKGYFAERLGRANFEKLWQKYEVDIAVYGHAHNYERTYPVYQNVSRSHEKTNYEGPFNGTIHVVAGGGGAHLAEFCKVQPNWSLFRDCDHGYVKLTVVDHSSLLFEYKKSSDGRVHDSFKISRDFRDLSTCAVDSCPTTTLAS